MLVHATGCCETQNWSEKPYHEEGEAKVKLTRANVATIFQGDITGQGFAEYLMCYRDQSSGNFVGLERIVGSVGGKTGSIVTQLTGTFGTDQLHADWAVVPGSGRGGLATLRGQGTYAWKKQQGRVTLFTFDYDFGD
jgi:Protein of unknown function (DUF3224)